MARIEAKDIHARIGENWSAVLQQLGIDERFLNGKHGPCPACGGKDRFRFAKGKPEGRFFCSPGGNGCGAGDGFALLMRVHGWKFPEAVERVMTVLGMTGEQQSFTPCAAPSRAQVARPTARIVRLRRERCAVEFLDDAINYLASRGLWPLPAGHALKAHPSLEYWDEGRSIGRFPALVGDVQDINGALVTVHVTYLQHGRKLENYDARKMLGPLTGRDGCAIRLMPVRADVLGVAEGIETALSAARLFDLPVWSTMNATLLGRFMPPGEVRKLVVFTDRDAAGWEGSARLMERLQGRVAVELKQPTGGKKDWNNVLMAKAGDESNLFDNYEVQQR